MWLRQSSVLQNLLHCPVPDNHPHRRRQLPRGDHVSGWVEWLEKEVAMGGRF